MSVVPYLSNHCHPIVASVKKEVPELEAANFSKLTVKPIS
jgi:hypothetical protein